MQWRYAISISAFPQLYNLMRLHCLNTRGPNIVLPINSNRNTIEVKSQVTLIIIQQNDGTSNVSVALNVAWLLVQVGAMWVFQIMPILWDFNIQHFLEFTQNVKNNMLAVECL